jgi:hypothetical protein
MPRIEVLLDGESAAAGLYLLTGQPGGMSLQVFRH